MACARWLLPVPPGPRNNASSRLPTKVHVARSNTRLRFIFGLKRKSKLSRLLCGSRKPACLRLRSNNRSPRRVSSSETRQAIRSIGAIGSAWAWRSRVSSTVAMPPSRSCRSACCSSMTFIFLLLFLFLFLFLLLLLFLFLILGLCLPLASAFDEIAVGGQFADQGIDLPQAQ